MKTAWYKEISGLWRVDEIKHESTINFTLKSTSSSESLKCPITIPDCKYWEHCFPFLFKNKLAPFNKAVYNELTCTPTDLIGNNVDVKLHRVLIDFKVSISVSGRPFWIRWSRGWGWNANWNINYFEEVKGYYSLRGNHN